MLQARRFPIVAFVEKLGARPRRVASLYLGRREGDGLLYAGKARTGYTEVTARALRPCRPCVLIEENPERLIQLYRDMPHDQKAVQKPERDCRHTNRSMAAMPSEWCAEMQRIGEAHVPGSTAGSQAGPLVLPSAASRAHTATSRRCQ